MSDELLAKIKPIPELADRSEEPAALRLNWRPDLPDQRDGRFTSKLTAAVLPTKVDMRAQCSSIENQFNVGSCTGNAIVGVLEFLTKKSGGTFVDLSRLFVYYNERMLENTIGEDAGAYIRTGMKVISRFGACTETLWPYSQKDWITKPTDAAYTDGMTRKFIKYKRITNALGMRKCLAEGYIFCIGISVYDSFMSDAVARTGRVPMPAIKEQLQGGHAICVVGYDDAKKVFICRNSWGTKWGDAGYFYMPYDYFSNSDLWDDAWTIRENSTIISKVDV